MGESLKQGYRGRGQEEGRRRRRRNGGRGGARVGAGRGGKERSRADGVALSVVRGCKSNALGHGDPVTWPISVPPPPTAPPALPQILPPPESKLRRSSYASLLRPRPRRNPVWLSPPDIFLPHFLIPALAAGKSLPSFPTIESLRVLRLLNLPPRTAERHACALQYARE